MGLERVSDQVSVGARMAPSVHHAAVSRWEVCADTVNLVPRVFEAFNDPQSLGTSCTALSTNTKYNQNQSLFPALGPDYMKMLRLLNWIGKVITLVLILLHSIENFSNHVLFPFQAISAPCSVSMEGLATELCASARQGSVESSVKRVSSQSISRSFFTSTKHKMTNWYFHDNYQSLTV